MSKQTAVEYLVHELHAAGFIEDITDPLLIQRVNEAKAMEREQIEDAYGVGHNDGCSYMTDGKTEFKNAEQYYDATYGKEAGHEA